MLLILLCLAIAYLSGSLSSAILLSRIFDFTDPREAGSGNAGANNILRYQGKAMAAGTLFGDSLKGFLPVLMAYSLIETYWLGYVALCTVIGHMFPIFFQFKGGKGVATAWGCSFALSPITAAGSILVWFLSLKAWRYSSLASILAAASFPLWFLLLHPEHFLPALCMSMLVIWQHRGNLQRLKDGTEPPIQSA